MVAETIKRLIGTITETGCGLMLTAALTLGFVLAAFGVSGPVCTRPRPLPGQPRCSSPSHATGQRWTCRRPGG